MAKCRRTSVIGFGLVAVVCLRATLGAQDAAGGRPPSPVTADTLTIEQAIQEALAHNRDLIAKREDVSVARTQLMTARLRPNPVFSFSADHLDWLGTGFNDTNGGGPTEISARVDVPLERGGKRTNRMGVAAVARSLAEANVAEAERLLRMTVELACIDVLQTAEHLALVRDTLRTFQDLASLNNDRVRAGAAAPSEATRTQVAMLQFRANVAKAELDLRSASIRLRQLLGRPLSSDPIDVIALPILEPSRPAPDLTDLQTLALQHRSDMRAAQQAAARSAADLRLQIAQGKVDFTWGGEYRRQTGPLSRSNSVGLFFSAPLPFLSRNQGEIARAGAEGTQARLQIAALEDTIRADVRTAFESYQSTRDLVTSIERDLLGPARSARDTAEYTYRARATTLVELIDSQRAWNDAMQTYQDAQADYRRAVARLDASVGVEVVR